MSTGTWIVFAVVNAVFGWMLANAFLGQEKAVPVGLVGGLVVTGLLFVAKCLHIVHMDRRTFLELSPAGIYREDPYTIRAMQWKDVDGFAFAHPLAPSLRIARHLPMNPGSPAATANKDLRVCLSGSGTARRKKWMSPLMYLAIVQNTGLWGTAPRRFDHIAFFPEEHEVDWRNGEFDRYLRAFRPDISMPAPAHESSPEK